LRSVDAIDNAGIPTIIALPLVPFACHCCCSPAFNTCHCDFTRGAPDSDDPRPQTLLPGAGPSTRAGYEVVQDWRTDHRCAGGHLVVDFDGVVYQLADLVSEETYHATTVNHRTIGIEIKQGRAQSELYAEQLAAVCDVVDAITARLGIQRQGPDRYRGPLARLSSGGADVWGVYGHRDQTDRRGFGDPGDYAMAALAARGYERHNFLAGDDKRVWRERQAALGFRSSSCDGLPGPLTRAALKNAGNDLIGYVQGYWSSMAKAKWISALAALDPQHPQE
jgi:hypothetical protein